MAQLAHSASAFLTPRRPSARAVILGTLVLAVALPIAALPLPLAAGLVGGGIVGVLILVRPEWALYLLALSIPFESLSQFDVAGASLGTTEALVGLLGLAWLLRRVAMRDSQPISSPLALPLGLVLVAVVVSTLRATALPPAVKEGVRWLEVLLVYVAGTDLLRSPRRRLALLVLLFAAGLAQAGLGIVQFLLRLGPDAFRTGGFLRAYGTFGQPNPYAGYLGTLLPLALAFLVVAWHDARVRGRPVFYLLLTVFGALGAALLASLSRGGWLGFALAVGVIGSLVSRRAFLATVATAVVGVFVVVLGALNVLPAQISDRLVQIVSYFGVFDVRTVVLSAANWAVVERMAIWQAAWGMFEANPILGVGPGNYPVAYDLFAMPGWKDSMGHAHNLYLNLLAEMGIVGLACFLVFWLSAIATTWRCFRSSARAPWWERALALGVLGVLAQVSLHNMFDNLTVHGLNVQLALLLALAGWSGAEDRKVVSS